MKSAPEFSEYVEMARVKAAQGRQQVEAASQQLERAQREHSFWDDLLACLERGHAAQALLVLRREGELFRDLQPSDDPVDRRMSHLRGELEVKARSAASSFGREFPPAARQVGLQIDSTSRHPKYTFKQGFVRLEVDERNLTAKVVPRDGTEIIMGIDVSLVVEKLRAELTRLFEREVDVQAFLRSLYTAYAAVLRTEGSREGDELPLRRVTNRLAKNLNRFAADEFNVDLSRLVQRGDLVVDGKRLHLNHTRDRRQGMLLQGLESGGYVGFISFKPERL